MKKILLILIQISWCTIAMAQHDMPMQTNKLVTKVIYTCVMHPEIQKPSPGKCPKCGMTLVKKTIKVKATQNQPAPKPSAHQPVKPDMSGMKDSTGKETKIKDMKDMASHDHSMTSSESVENTQPYIFERINLLPGKTIRYDLYITDTIVNFTGKSKHAYAINGSIPGPTLIFTEGDTAAIYLHNMLPKRSTSLHWHGVILPNRFDGVPHLTTVLIKPGDTHLYKFPIVQTGTYWYHSHSALQEQQGMYGALVFKKRGQSEHNNVGAHYSHVERKSTKEYTIVLSEWADERPTQIQRRLRTGNDWYAIQKGSTQSYSEAIVEGFLKTKVTNEWKRMKAMDVSDVFYNRFLINGRPQSTASEFKAGDNIRLRVVNGGASSYFWLQYGGGKITVIGNDGNDVDPVEVDRLIIAPAETYDLMVTIPENMSYEFSATSEDRTNHASVWLGTGMQMPAPILPRLKYFSGMKMMNGMMKTNGNMKDMGMQMHNQVMDMNTVMYPEITGSSNSDSTMDNPMVMTNSKDTAARENIAGMDGMNMNMGSGDIVTLNYGMLRFPAKTSLPDGQTKVIKFMLTGNMNRYVWTLDNKTVNETDRILIKKGENVRIILTNNSMMRHPMHLHGHDFRVLNGQGEYAPLKNVIDIMPMETDTIEFAANQSGDWFFHCHILFHMMAGMGRVFSYENSPVNPELTDTKKEARLFKKNNTMYHLMARVGLEFNGTDGEAMVSTNRYAVQEMWHLGTHAHHGYESETNVGRYFGRNQWIFAYAGFDYHYKKEDPMHMEGGHDLIGNNIFGSDTYNMFGQQSNKNDRKTIMVGIQYLLLMLVLADARVDGNGKFRFQLSREDVPVTKRLRFNIMANTDKEYMAGFRYIINKWFAVSTHYDSDMGLGAGVTLTY